MTKKKNNINIEHELCENIEDITIEEIDKEINNFYIDEKKIESIKYNFDKETFIKEAIDKAEKDINKNKIKKRYIKIAASILIVLSIGIYNPALAYRVPPIMKFLEQINNTLKIDEISAILQLDTVIPKAVVENDKIDFIKMTSYKVQKEENNNEVGNDDNQLDNDTDSKNSDKDIVYNEYEVVNFIHRMANTIINPADGKKFGVTEITPENISIALNSIGNINNDEARNYLIKELTRWKKGDFSNGVEVHNYVWHMLDGQIGIASSLDDNEINKIKEKYFK